MLIHNKKSYYYNLKHFNDHFLNLGYNYSGNILKNTISPEMYANPIQWSNYNQIEKLLLSLINNVKRIRTNFSIAHDKNSTLIN